MAELDALGEAISRGVDKCLVRKGYPAIGKQNPRVQDLPPLPQFGLTTFGPDSVADAERWGLAGFYRTTNSPAVIQSTDSTFDEVLKGCTAEFENKLGDSRNAFNEALDLQSQIEGAFDAHRDVVQEQKQRRALLGCLGGQGFRATDPDQFIQRGIFRDFGIQLGDYKTTGGQGADLLNDNAASVVSASTGTYVPLPAEIELAKAVVKCDSTLHYRQTQLASALAAEQTAIAPFESQLAGLKASLTKALAAAQHAAAG